MICEAIKESGFLQTVTEKVAWKCKAGVKVVMLGTGVGGNRKHLFDKKRT